MAAGAAAAAAAAARKRRIVANMAYGVIQLEPDQFLLALALEAGTVGRAKLRDFILEKPAPALSLPGQRERGGDILRVGRRTRAARGIDHRRGATDQDSVRYLASGAILGQGSWLNSKIYSGTVHRPMSSLRERPFSQGPNETQIDCSDARRTFASCSGGMPVYSNEAIGGRKVPRPALAALGMTSRFTIALKLSRYGAE